MSPEQCKILVQEQPTLATAGTQIILWTFQSNPLHSTSIVEHIVTHMFFRRYCYHTMSYRDTKVQSIACNDDLVHVDRRLHGHSVMPAFSKELQLRVAH